MQLQHTARDPLGERAYEPAALGTPSRLDRLQDARSELGALVFQEAGAFANLVKAEKSWTGHFDGLGNIIAARELYAEISGKLSKARDAEGELMDAWLSAIDEDLDGAEGAS